MYRLRTKGLPLTALEPGEECIRIINNGTPLHVRLEARDDQSALLYTVSHGHTGGKPIHNADVHDKVYFRVEPTPYVELKNHEWYYSDGDLWRVQLPTESDGDDDTKGFPGIGVTNSLFRHAQESFDDEEKSVLKIIGGTIEVVVDVPAGYEKYYRSLQLHINVIKANRNSISGKKKGFLSFGYYEPFDHPLPPPPPREATGEEATHEERGVPKTFSPLIGWDSIPDKPNIAPDDFSTIPSAHSFKLERGKWVIIEEGIIIPRYAANALHLHFIGVGERRRKISISSYERSPLRWLIEKLENKLNLSPPEKD